MVHYSIRGIVPNFWLKGCGDALGISPLHVTFEHTLHFKLQCNELKRLGYQHTSDNQPFDCGTFVWVLTVHGYELRLFWDNEPF